MGVFAALMRGSKAAALLAAKEGLTTGLKYQRPGPGSFFRQRGLRISNNLTPDTA